MARMKLLERNNARRAAIVAKKEAEQVRLYYIRGLMSIKCLRFWSSIRMICLLCPNARPLLGGLRRIDHDSSATISTGKSSSQAESSAARGGDRGDEAQDHGAGAATGRQASPAGAHGQALETRR